MAKIKFLYDISTQETYLINKGRREQLRMEFIRIEFEQNPFHISPRSNLFVVHTRTFSFGCLSQSFDHNGCDLQIHTLGEVFCCKNRISWNSYHQLECFQRLHAFEGLHAWLRGNSTAFERAERECARKRTEKVEVEGE